MYAMGHARLGWSAERADLERDHDLLEEHCVFVLESRRISPRNNFKMFEYLNDRRPHNRRKNHTIFSVVCKMLTLSTRTPSTTEE